jgi:hypothetical protein
VIVEIDTLSAVTDARVVAEAARRSCMTRHPVTSSSISTMATDERGESFLSESHGRDHDMEQEIALNGDGKILALRVTGYGNMAPTCRTAPCCGPLATSGSWNWRIKPALV